MHLVKLCLREKMVLFLHFNLLNMMWSGLKQAEPVSHIKPENVIFSILVRGRYEVIHEESSGNHQTVQA
jgi:hypothetical protein